MKSRYGLNFVYASICSLVAGYAFIEFVPSCSFDSSRFRRAKGDILKIHTAIQNFESEAAFLPTTEQGLDALVVKPVVPPLPENWQQTMRKLPLDPWSREYRYRNPGVNNPDGFDVFSLGADGIESVDDVRNWED